MTNIKYIRRQLKRSALSAQSQGREAAAGGGRGPARTTIFFCPLRHNYNNHDLHTATVLKYAYLSFVPEKIATIADPTFSGTGGGREHEARWRTQLMTTTMPGPTPIFISAA